MAGNPQICLIGNIADHSEELIEFLTKSSYQMAARFEFSEIEMEPGEVVHQQCKDRVRETARSFLIAMAGNPQICLLGNIADHPEEMMKFLTRSSYQMAARFEFSEIEMEPGEVIHRDEWTLKIEKDRDDEGGRYNF